MGTRQGVGLAQDTVASPASYIHNFLVYSFFMTSAI